MYISTTNKIFIVVFFFLLLETFLFSKISHSATILGTGTGALLGGDLTDPEDDGNDGTASGSNFNWVSINASSKNTFSGEGAYNVFDNKVGAGAMKWCCDAPTRWIYVQLSKSYQLTHFTIASGNDSPDRDPDKWKIQGSNDGSNWTDIYEYDNDGTSPFSARNQVIRYNGAGADFNTPSSYSYFRFIVTSKVSGSMFQINELEFFGTPDTTNPTLSSSTPADNATSVSSDANIVLNFDESVDAETGNITIKKTSDNSTIETIDVTGSKVTGSGSSQITVNPATTLDSLTEYYVLIDATAFDDISSNSYAGISSTTALSFTTANVLPTLSSSTPADNATSVSRDANIVLNFSEIVDVETGNITIKKKSDNSTFETIGVTSSNVTGTGTTQITINPTSNFDADTEYYVLIDATAFDDVSSGSYVGISSTTALSFTTESMTDPITDKDVVGSIDTQSQLAKNIVTQSTSTVSNRLSYLRKNKGNDNLSKNNIKLDFGNAILTSLTNELLAKNDKSIIPDNWSSWSEGSISVSKIGDSLGSSSSETDAQAIALGFDTKLNDNDLLGFAVQYNKSDTDIGSSGSATDSENINLSVYRTRPLNEDNFIEGMFGVGLIESDLKRISGSNTLNGSRNGKQIFGSINYGKTLDKGDFNLTPVARLNLGYTELDAYSETGTDALSYGKQTIESGLASVGLEFSDIVKFNDNKLKPFGSIEYGMDFSNSSDAKMNYVSDTSTIYTYTQGANSNHLITSVVGFEYITKDNLEIISSYKRIQGNESEQTDILNVSVNFRSKQETEYAMSIDGSEDLKAGFDITKKVNGFDLKFNANQSLSENSDQTANVFLSRSF
jgi:methionine-rich copper-binding protein CopC/uncharacterized protein YhjY with autotransporter beta-barrel domain